VPADIRAVGFARPDARRETGMDERAILLFHFVALPAMTPIESAIGMEEGPVNVRCVACVFEAADDHLALIGHTVAVGIGQLPDTGRRRDVERAIEPDAALRESQLIREYTGFVVYAIAVSVGEKEHAVGQFPFQPRLIEICPRRITDEKLPARTDRGHDGMLDQRRPRCHLCHQSLG